MLTAFAVHGGFGLQLQVTGDLHVDCHHTIEDTGIVLGKAFQEALQDKGGIARFGSFYVPMDEALAFCSLDISGRPFLVFQAEFAQEQVGSYDSCMTEEFFPRFGNQCRYYHAREIRITEKIPTIVLRQFIKQWRMPCVWRVNKPAEKSFLPKVYCNTERKRTE